MSDRPAPTGDHVFISYSRKDTDFADKLRNDLRKAGFNVWIDRTGLPPGTRNWDKAIRHAINSSFAVLWLVSPNSYDSEFVQDEIAIADMLNRAIYPVWVAGENWFDCVPLGMGKSMHIDARSDNYSNAIEQIARALRGEKPELAVLPTPMPAPVPETKLVTEPRNPYKGLRAFREEDAGDFFGRDTLIEELRYTLERRLQENRARFLAVTGPSGSGKSSIIMAGLLPRLKNGALIDSENWTYLPPIKPGAYPIEALAEALCTVLPNRTEQSISESLNNPTGAGLHILGLEAAVQRRSQRVILFIDQFEELFTQTATEEERQQFINTLVHAVTDAGSPISVIVTMRADMYDRPMNYPQLATLLDHNSRSVLPMRLVDLREAIERPALLPDVQIAFDANLVGDIVFELRDQSDALAGALPLLQFTLAQLFELRKGNLLTQDAYRALGGVRGALTKKADETYLELKGEQQQLARWLFMRLIDPGEDEQTTTRRRAALSELTLQTEQQTRMMQDVANRFVDARLLLVDQVGGVRTIEVAHEAIIREWGRLREWLQETRSDIGRMKKLAMDAAEWVRGGRRDDDDVLYRGSVLEEARRWVTNPNTAASADERAFVEAGMRQQSAQDEREHQRTEEVKNASLRAMQAKQSAEAAEVREKEAAKRALEQEKRAERARRSVSIVGGIAALIALAAVGLGLWASTQVTESTARESSANTQIAVAQVQVTQAAISLADAQNSQQAAETLSFEALTTASAAEIQAAAANDESLSAQSTAQAAGTDAAVNEAEARAAQATANVVSTAAATAQLGANAASTQVEQSEATAAAVSTAAATAQLGAQIAATQVDQVQANAVAIEATAIAQATQGARSINAAYATATVVAQAFALQAGINEALLSEATDDEIVALQNLIDQDAANINARIQLGDIYYSRALYNDALDTFTAALDIDAQNPALLNRRGLCHAALTDFRAAVDDFSAATELAPEEAEYFANLGSAYRELRRYDDAIEVLNTSITLSPDTARGYAELGRTYARQGEHEAAVEQFTLAIERDATNASLFAGRGDAYLFQGEAFYDDAEQDYQAAFELDSNNADYNARLGEVLHRQEQHTDAIFYLNRAVVINPMLHESWAWMGASYYALEDYQRAVDNLTSAISVDSTQPAYYDQRGDAHLALESFESALVDYQAALDRAPDNPTYTANIGNAHRALGDYEQAIEFLERATELDSDFAWAWNVLGDTYIEQGEGDTDQSDYDAAVIAYETAIDLEPNNVDYIIDLGIAYRVQGEYGNSVAEIRRALNLDPTSAVAHFQLAETLRAQGNIDDAIESYTEAIELDLENPLYYSRRGNLFFAEEEYEDAAADYQDAITYDPDNAVYYFYLGDTYRAMGEYYTAIGYLTQAVVLDNKYFIAYARLGDSHYQLRNYADAIEAYTRALEVDSAQPGVYNARGNAYFSLGGADNYELAIADYERAIELQTDDQTRSVYMSNLGNTYYRLRDYDEAIEWSEEAIALDDSNAYAYYTLGLVAVSEEEYEDAIEYFSAAIERYGDDPNFYFYRGISYLLVGDNRNAVRDLEEATELAPDNREYWRVLGIVRENMNDCEEALAAYTRYVELDPVNADSGIRDRIEALEEECG